MKITRHIFTGGEWAPSLYGRTDLAKFPTACKRMKNFFPHPHGGASNRGGTQFVGETKDSSKSARLIPFQFSVVQSYILEFGDYYLRVIKDGGYVEMTLATTTDWATTTVYAAGDFRKNGGVIYYCLVNHTSGTFATDLAAGKWIAQSIYEVPTPYAQADLALLKTEQSADVLYIWHPSYDERKLSRTGHTSWTLTQVSFQPSIAAPSGFSRTAGTATGYSYTVTAISATGEESVGATPVSGGRGDTLGWSAVTGADHYDLYEGVNGVYEFIGSANGLSYVVPATPSKDDTLTPPIAKNPFSGADNKPGCGAFHQQRLVRARTNNAPQSLFGSVTGSFENMNVSVPVRADDAYTFTINSRQVNEIRWLVSLNVLIIGTSGSEWKMSPGSDTDAITATSIDLAVQSRWGVSHVAPIVIGSTLLFIEGSGKAVRDFAYSLESDGFKGDDVSLLAKHLLEFSAIKEWAYQQHPDSMIWCVREDGGLVALTYYREHEVWGWSEHETDGTFESVASITSSEGVDEVYVIVNRTINGSTKRYVEMFRSRLPSTDVEDAYFVDCGLSLDNPIDITGATQANPVVISAAAHGFSNGDTVRIMGVEGMTEINQRYFTVANKTTDTFELSGIDGTEYGEYTSGGEVREAVDSISGLEHLEGKNVAVLADGSVVDGLVVTSGAITLPHEASIVHVGLPYESILVPMPFVYNDDEGDVQSDIIDINEVMLKLANTREVLVGPDEDRLFEVKFRETEDYGVPIALFTGQKQITVSPGDGEEAEVMVKVVDPVPCTVLSITVKVTDGDT